MKAWHGIIILLIGYFIGAYWGGAATATVSKVQSLV